MSTPEQIEQAMYERCVAEARKEGVTSVAHLQQTHHMSHNGAVEFLERMQREGIVGAPDEGGAYHVLN